MRYSSISNRTAQWQWCKACVSHTLNTAVYSWEEYNCHTLRTPWSQICDTGVEPATYLRGHKPQRGKRSKKRAFSQNTLCPANYTHIFMQNLSCESPQTYALSAVNSITPPKWNTLGFRKPKLSSCTYNRHMRVECFYLLSKFIFHRQGYNVDY